MKLKNLKFLSIILALAFIISIIPANTAFASDLDSYLTFHDIKLVNKNSSNASKDFKNNKYYVQGESCNIQFSTCSKEKYCYVTIKDANIDNKKYEVKKGTVSFPIPTGLPVGNRTIKMKLGNYTYTLIVGVIKQSAYHFCDNIFTQISPSEKNETFYKNTFNLSVGNTGAYNIAHDAYQLNRRALEKASLSNEGFVHRLYKGTLDRNEDVEGLNWWVNELNLHHMTREQVYEFFITSSEFQNIVCKYLKYKN
jgi:hypothetical protein